jgi:hypothetical protein
VPTWDASLPQTFDSEGLTYAPGRNMLENAPEVGPVMARRRSTAAPDQIGGQLILDQAQAATFIAFVKTTLAEGVFPFDGFRHPILGTTIAKAAIKDGWGGCSWGVRNPYATVSFTLYVLP